MQNAQQRGVFVVRQTKNARQRHFFAVSQTKETHDTNFLIKSKFYIEKHQNYQMASEITKILHRATYVVYCI
jgi:hypothetical protein